MSRVELAATTSLPSQPGTEVFVYQVDGKALATGYTTQTGSVPVAYPLRPSSDGSYPTAWFECDSNAGAPGGGIAYVLEFRGGVSSFVGMQRKHWHPLLFAYHGGVAGLAVGELVLPASALSAPFGPFPASYSDPYSPAHLKTASGPRRKVCTTQSFNGALMFAAAWPEGDMYEVEMHGWHDGWDDAAECASATVVRVLNSGVQVFWKDESGGSHRWDPFADGWAPTKRTVIR